MITQNSMKRLGWMVMAVVWMALVGVGCAHRMPSTAGYEVILNSWEGEDVDSLLDAWGNPVDTVKLPNGNTVLVYRTVRTYTSPTYYTTNYNSTSYGNSTYGTATTTQYGGVTTTYRCRTEFEVRGDTIVRSSHKGNDCTARAPAYLGVESTSKKKGVRVTRVVKRSAAAQAGIRKNDIITEIDNISINNNRDIQRVLRKYKAGDKVKVELLRGGDRVVLRFRLSSNPEWR